MKWMFLYPYYVENVQSRCDDLEEWCVSNCEGDYLIQISSTNIPYITFTNDDDAMYFKLITVDTGWRKGIVKD